MNPLPSKSASFVIPVVNGDIYLGCRGTEPHKGLYSAIGGKPEKFQGVDREFSYVGTVCQAKIPSISDELAIKAGLETPLEAAVREFNEELYSNTLTRDQMRDEFRLGLVVDTPNPGIKFACRFYLLSVDTDEFKPSTREITEVTKLRDIRNTSEINLITQIALAQLDFCYRSGLSDNYTQLNQYENLNKQIPSFPLFPNKFTGMMGAVLNMHGHSSNK